MTKNTAKPLNKQFASICLALTLALSLVILSYVSLVVFRDYPYSMDEYGYLYQAQIFASGKTYLSLSEEARPLVEQWMICKDGKLFSKYPPGFSAILSLGVLARSPGLVNPILGTLCLLLFYLLTASFLGRRFALLTVLLTCTNSYFIGYAASYFSQTASLLFCTLALYCYRRYQQRHNVRWATLAGCSIAAGFFVRPLDAFCSFLVLVPAVVLISLKTKRAIAGCLFILTVLLGIVLLCVYNARLTGTPSIAAYAVWKSDFVLEFKNSGTLNWLSMLWHSYCQSFLLNTLRNFYYKFLPKLGFPLIALTVTGASASRRRALWVYWLIPIIFVILYNFHQGFGWPVYGTRYWYPALNCIAVFVAHGLYLIHRRLGRRLLIGLFGLCLIWNCLNTLTDLSKYSAHSAHVQRVLADIDRRCPPHSIVILKANKGMFDFKRNSIFAQTRLYVFTPQEAAQIQRLFPTYNICVYPPND